MITEMVVMDYGDADDEYHDIYHKDIGNDDDDDDQDHDNGYNDPDEYDDNDDTCWWQP